MSDPRSAILITAADLAARLDAREPVVVLDVSDELAAAPAGRSFIPGAFATCLATHFSGAPSKAGGKRPLPDSADFQAKARGWGVNPDTLVVVYDDNAGAQAARAWWTFRWAGFGNVRLLDGGLGAWKAAGRPVASAPATAGSAGSVVLSAGQMPTLDADQSARLARDGVLLDARGRAAYLGAPPAAGKPPAGHIPGALSAPSALGVGADGCFKSVEELRAAFAALGADGARPTGVYCGSGNAAAHLLAALAVTGVEAPLYVGSWSAWSADPARPVAIGPEPG